MSTFGITDPSQMMDAVNYALSNLGQSTTSTGNSVSINTTTGQISQGNNLLSYYYKYLYVAYSNAADGSSGFSTTVYTNKLYFGVLNNNSTSPSTINNPASYQWTEVAGGGFGTTYELYYTTIGGRQIGFIVDTSLPASGYVQAPTSPSGIDLDFVTQVAALPIVVMTAYQRANATPATPTGGTYDFGNLIFTAPSGWSNSIPTGNTGFYSSQNTFKATSTGNITVGPSAPWTTAVLTGQIGANGSNGTNGANGVSTFFYSVFQSANSAPATPTGGYYNFGTSLGTPPTGWSNTPISANGAPIYASSTTVSSTNPTANVSIGNAWGATYQYTGAGGAPGSRGPIPMGYVLTPSTPVGASNANLTTWWASATTNTVAPIGSGLAPVDADVGAFTWSANTAVVKIYQFNGTTQTWADAPGQAINGNVFITGSVNASKLNANEVYTLVLKGGNAVLDSNTSGGFWANAFSGNARFGGSMSIGNLLTVGSNATIGGNLSVGANANIANNLTIGNLLTVGSNAKIGGNLIIGNNASIGGNLTVAGLITGNGAGGASLNANTVQTTTIIQNAVTSSNQGQFPAYVLSIDGPITAGNTYGIGTFIANSANSSGNTITTNTPFGGWTGDVSIVNSRVTKISGTGTLAANTVVTAAVTGNSFTVTPTPTVALSNAVVQLLPDIPTSPYLPITTTAANQLVQLNFNGTIFLDTKATALQAGVYAQLLVYVDIYRYDSTLTSGTYVWTAILTSTQVFINNAFYSFVVPFSITGIFDFPPTAGTFYYIPFISWDNFQGTFTVNDMAVEAYAVSGTVLKR